MDSESIMRKVLSGVVQPEWTFGNQIVYVVCTVKTIG